MRLVFLGTGTSQGVPVIACRCPICRSDDKRDKRLRSSALITTDSGSNILIDIGPDFREQMLREQVEHLDAILVTHSHRDHVGGLDDIRSFNYVQHTHMQLFANSLALQSIQHDYGYIFQPHQFAGLPEADLHEVSQAAPFTAAGCTIMPIAAMHKTLPVLGYRIGPVVYLTDCNYVERSEVEKMKGCEVMVVGALRKTRHYSHFCLPEALDLIVEVAPRKAYLTHISHEMGLHAIVESELPDNVHLAYDGLRIDM